MKLHQQTSKKILFVLLTVVVSLVLVAPTFATWGPGAMTMTDTCRNYENEGIKYHLARVIGSSDADIWRYPFVITDSLGGSVIGVEMEVTSDSTRYQCTEDGTSGTYEFTCNSIPVGATVTDIYFDYVPPSTTPPDTLFQLQVESVAFGKTILSTDARLKYPAYPCARNEYYQDWRPQTDSALVVNTNSSCEAGNSNGGGSDSTLRFTDKSGQKFTIVNQVPGDTLVGDRFKLVADPQRVSYSYNITLEFEDPQGNRYDVAYSYTEGDNELQLISNGLDGLSNSDMPLTFVEGWMDNISTTKTDLYGNPNYPTSTDFDFKFYYENELGKLGYENSDYHCERSLNIQFGPYCKLQDNLSEVPYAAASTRYDHCQTSSQLFTINYEDSNGQFVPVPDSYMFYCTTPMCTTDAYVNMTHDAVPAKNAEKKFILRKCTDSACTTTAETSAYIYSITVSDGDNLNTTYKAKGHKKSVNTFNMKVYDRTNPDYYPFQIRNVRIMATEPGTYEIRGFAGDDISEYAVKMYATINETDSLETCSVEGTNGYYTAKWNDCLDDEKTQLLSFVPENTENGGGYIVNKSAQGMYFYFNSEYSYTPIPLEIASLKCSFKSIADGGNAGAGYCTKEYIYVPPYTKGIVNEGTFYLHSIPDEATQYYKVAYAREDTFNKMVMNIDIDIKACENVDKIPNTGISMRTGLHPRVSANVDPSADAASNFVFTGNSLMIPAIGLGMEVPIPIVHVYYEDNDSSKGWDLSMLGGYVGELEGGQYLPYAGNTALTGHYYSQGVFKNLEYLNVGDEIIIFGNDGFKYIYHVTEKFITEPSDVYAMFQQVGERSLTLVTCENYNLVTDEYERRQLIRATISSVEPYEMK